MCFLLAIGCGQDPPIIPLDTSAHNVCSESVPHAVDASASEIQCLVENYVFSTEADTNEPIQEQGANVPGLPVCCEVCATQDTADDACSAMCNYQLCDRARDAHVAAGWSLGFCSPSDCGFDFDTCVQVGALHTQVIDLIDPGDSDVFYTLQSLCHATSVSPARPDGLFEYIESLQGIPGAGGMLADVEDVVGYCLGSPGGQTGGTLSADGSSAPGTNSGADSTGEEPQDPTVGTPSNPDLPEPLPCGPYAEARYWVRPTNNFGTWNEESHGFGLDGAQSHVATVSGGGITYTVLPCGAGNARCLRLDELSVMVHEPGSGLELELNLVQSSGPLPMSTNGQFDVPTGSLRFSARFLQGSSVVTIEATNDDVAVGAIDAADGEIHIDGLQSSSEDGSLLASLSLRANLHNTQPSSQIMQEKLDWNRVRLTAQTFDAEFDPVDHYWMIPGVGRWAGESIDVELPAGRHAVILHVDDVHRARGVAAAWVDVVPVGS